MTNKELIEFVLSNESEIRKAVFERRQDGCLPKTGGGSSGHCRISDPTAQNAIRNVLDVPTVVVEYGPAICGRRNSVTLRHPERWLKVAEYTREYFAGSVSGRIMVMRYRENKTRQEICSALKINKPRFFTMLSNICKFAEGVAIGMGVIAPRH
ncbi:MAG: hypothetical protein DBY32_04010 [Phascolarctobacterium sp.]|nr:MAG: hypothetical protein DBY32_04010 [Phascolarctobacterium sp.]